MAPPFLVHLGLDAAADDRAIRRAYAQRLKQIDQEEDAAGFQALRQAYELAMHWFASEGEQETATLRSDVYEQFPKGELAQEARVDQGSQEPRQPVQERGLHRIPERPLVPDESMRQEAARATETSARQALEELRTLLQHGDRDARAKVLAWLKQVMSGDRLIDMDARFLFEGGVAALLAEGWRSGHEHLFGPAMDCFEWRSDRGRLTAFGRKGAIIAAAISELDFYDAQPKRVRIPQRDLIRLLRDGRRPSTGFLLRHQPMAEYLHRMFPHWLHLITDVSNVERWNGWAQSVPRWRRVLAYTPPLSKPPKVRSSSWAMRACWTFFALLMLSALMRAFTESPSPGRSAPAPLRTPASSGALPPFRPQDALSQTAVGAHASAAMPLRPAYPLGARRLGHEGSVMVSATIGTDGRVRNANVLQSSGYQDLDDAALAEVRDAAFLPAKDRMGLPLESTYRIPIHFKLSDKSSAPTTGLSAKPRDYGQRVRDTFLAQILVQDYIVGNPVAEVTLRVNEQGEIKSHRLTGPSGSKVWDDAVLAAVRRVRRVPMDDSGKVQPEMVLTFRPKP